MINKYIKKMLFSSALILSAATVVAKPVRVAVFEPTSYPNFQQLGCTNNQLDTPNCRVHKKLNCPTQNVNSCIVDESALDNGNFGQDHATEVSKLVIAANNDIELISAKGNALGVMRWIKHNHQANNIKVLNRTDGGAPSPNQTCSDANIYHKLDEYGISVTHSSGNQWSNGLTYDPALGYAPKGVSDASCAYKVLSIGASGMGLLKEVNIPGHGFHTKCHRPESYYGDLPPNTDISTYSRVSIDCYSNAGTHLDYLAEPHSGMGEGTSFSAPRVAGTIANYHTRFPGRSNANVVSYLNGVSSTANVNYGSINDSYKRLTTSTINQNLNAMVHTIKEGYWYNSERSGWGLYVAEKNNKHYITWYTYDQNGKPIWYSSNGTFFGNVFQGPIIKTSKPIINQSGTNYTLTNGAYIRIELLNKQDAIFTWDFKNHEQGTSGSERIEHLPSIGEGADGSYNGLWYNQLDSGWGLSTNFKYGWSGDNFTALFYHDSAGNPIWASGVLHNAGSNGTVQLSYYQGFCQGCTWSPLVPTSAGSLTYDYMTQELYVNVFSPYAWPRAGETDNQGWLDITNITFE